MRSISEFEDLEGLFIGDIMDKLSTGKAKIKLYANLMLSSMIQDQPNATMDDAYSLLEEHIPTILELLVESMPAVETVEPEAGNVQKASPKKVITKK